MGLPLFCVNATENTQDFPDAFVEMTIAKNVQNVMPHYCLNKTNNVVLNWPKNVAFTLILCCAL